MTQAVPKSMMPGQLNSCRPLCNECRPLPIRELCHTTGTRIDVPRSQHMQYRASRLSKTCIRCCERALQGH
jgi:hypothetical protein